jgi:hypothetical protein
MSTFIATFKMPDYPDDSYNLFFRPAGTVVRKPYGVFDKAVQYQDKYVVQKNGNPTYDPGGYSIECDTFAAAWEAFHEFTADLDRLYTR